MPPKDSGKRGIQPRTPLPANARPPRPTPDIKVGDFVRIVPQEWSGDDVERYRDAVGVVRTVIPRPDRNAILVGVRFNGESPHFLFFSEETVPEPAPPSATISLDDMKHAELALRLDAGRQRLWGCFGEADRVDAIAERFRTAIAILEGRANQSGILSGDVIITSEEAVSDEQPGAEDIQ